MVEFRTTTSSRAGDSNHQADGPYGDLLPRFFPRHRIFEIGDQRFFLIEESCWLATKLEKPVEVDLRARICGHIGIDGIRHVVLENAKGPPCHSSCSVLQVLTRRELEIAQLIAIGLGNKEIGRRLGISYFTVREHVRRVAQKLQVNSRSAIAARVGAPREGPR